MPTRVMEPYRVRTSYEKVIAHRTKPPFAYCAEEDGKVLSIDNEAKIMKIEYKSGKLMAVEFGDSYLKNGGGGFYCTQSVAINGFKAGDKFSRGDVLVYNENFFSADPYSKQVDLNLGAIANVAFLETNYTHEDGNAISSTLAKKLAIEPVHIRDVVLNIKTTVHSYADVGTMVKSVEPILIFDQSEMDESMFGGLDDESAALLSKLNRQTPRAKFTGKVVQIDAYYKCPDTDLSPSLKRIVSSIEKIAKAKATAASGSENAANYGSTLQIKYTDRIGLTDVDDQTIILRFYIQQDMGMDIGSKLEILSSLKTVCAYIKSEPWNTDDKDTKVDMMYSEIGVNNRIINSPKLCGMAAKVMEKLEQDILKEYFG